MTGRDAPKSKDQMLPVRKISLVARDFVRQNSISTTVDLISISEYKNTFRKKTKKVKTRMGKYYIGSICFKKL